MLCLWIFIKFELHLLFQLVSIVIQIRLNIVAYVYLIDIGSPNVRESSQSEGFEESVWWTILLYFGRSLPLYQRFAIICLLRNSGLQPITSIKLYGTLNEVLFYRSPI